MCTLIFGRDVLGPGSVVLGANRDEDSGRPSDPPRALSTRPPVVGGRDGVAGGTWLAIRDGWTAIAVLNRRPAPPERRSGATPHPGVAPRSRGLLALDVARVEPDIDRDAFRGAALLEAQRAIREEPYAPFTLACLGPTGGWVLTRDDDAPAQVVEPAPGWHVVTHEALDSASEPRTASLLAALHGFAPTTALEAEARLLELLSRHGEGTDGPAARDPANAPTGAAAAALVGVPAVCIHRGRMVTVSTTLFTRTPERARYLHLEGRPCTGSPQDLTRLLEVAR